MNEPRRPVGLIPAEEAVLGSAPVLPVMAHALAMVTHRVPASAAAFFVGLHKGPVVTRVDPAFGSRQALEDAYREYRRFAPYRDPFVSEELQRTSRVATIEDVAERSVFDRTHYGRFLRGFGVHAQATVYLRRGDVVVGRIVLLRVADMPAFDTGELAFLHVSQRLIELAYGSVCSVQQAGGRSSILSVAGLTPRQADVARLAAAGATNLEIGRALHLSPSTVKTHLGNVFAKLGVRSRTELAALLGTQAPRREDAPGR